MSRQNDRTERDGFEARTRVTGTELEPTGTPSAAPSKRPASTKSRPPHAKAKSAKADGTPAPRSRRAPALAKKTGGPPSKRLTVPRSKRGTRDEASIPPTWSDLDEHGEPVVTADATPFASVITALSPPPSLVSAPSADTASEPVPVLVPRPLFSPYLKAVAGLAAAVCMVVLGGRVLRHPRPIAANPSFGAAAAAVAVQPAAVDPIPDTAPVAADPPADTASTESADDAKRASLTALELGKLDEAIVAGQRATELDPTDADAWRVLGAAYQNQGDVTAARRCYRECTKSAKRGDVRECTFLLQ